MNRSRIPFLPIALVLVTACGAESRSSAACAAGNGGTVAPASVYFLNETGHRIRSARVKSTIQFVLRFTSPRAYPSGYTDLRFTVYVHGKAQRTIIYGAPKHIMPGTTLTVAVPVSISPTWLGTVKVIGTVTLFAKPDGSLLHRAGRGGATLTVTR
jgi:hypothetical protein